MQSPAVSPSSCLSPHGHIAAPNGSPDSVDTLLLLTHLTDLLSVSIPKRKNLNSFFAFLSCLLHSRHVVNPHRKNKFASTTSLSTAPLSCKTIQCGHRKPQVAARPRQMTEFGPTRVDSHLTKRFLCANSSPIHSKYFFTSTS